jgi:hypothetical protein
MRAAPSVISVTGTDYYYLSKGSPLTADFFNSIVNIFASQKNGAMIYNNDAGQISGTQGQAYVAYTNNASSFISFQCGVIIMINTIKKNYYNGNFVSYTITYVDSNIQLSVPLDEANTDYQAIQEWIAEGNTVIDNGGNNNGIYIKSRHDPRSKRQ